MLTRAMSRPSFGIERVPLNLQEPESLATEAWRNADRLADERVGI
jgi:hypothetical protein